MEKTGTKRRKSNDLPLVLAPKRACRRSLRHSTHSKPGIGLEDLPAEILQQILVDSCELSLIHTSRRLYAALPSYLRWANKLLRLCFLQATNSPDDENWLSTKKARRASLPGLKGPLEQWERLDLQRKVLNSCWLGVEDLLFVTYDILHFKIREVLDDYDLSVASSMKINHLRDNLWPVFQLRPFELCAQSTTLERIRKISIPNQFVIEELDDEAMTLKMHPTLDVLHIPEKLLKPPFTDANINTLAWLRRAWDSSCKVGAKLDVDSKTVRTSIEHIIATEKAIEKYEEYVLNRTHKSITMDIMMLVLLLEFETASKYGGFKDCPKDEYFKAAISGGKLASLDALITIDPCWSRKMKIRNMVKRLLAEKPNEKFTEAVELFVSDRRVETKKYAAPGWPPRKGHCGVYRTRVVRSMLKIEDYGLDDENF